MGKGSPIRAEPRASPSRGGMINVTRMAPLASVSGTRLARQILVLLAIAVTPNCMWRRGKKPDEAASDWPTPGGQSRPEPPDWAGFEQRDAHCCAQELQDVIQTPRIGLGGQTVRL